MYVHRMGGWEGLLCSCYAVFCGCYALIYSQSGTCPRCVHCQQVTATLQVMTHNELTHNELTHVRLNYDTNCQVWQLLAAAMTTNDITAGVTAPADLKPPEGAELDG